MRLEVVVVFQSGSENDEVHGGQVEMDGGWCSGGSGLDDVVGGCYLERARRSKVRYGGQGDSLARVRVRN
ncbi:proline-rich receptor-like protein kinase PERK9 [Iris pallida]|uniref:Proline-rich receptor-like protein kinase PERK9 n=1 Tax=Iris pallida TaxID=29817 RepID=A0AAX6GYP4_IRIPA|nr:proline-rich receptor-like protein kinase PERK9 [Iris pallida]